MVLLKNTYKTGLDIDQETVVNIGRRTGTRSTRKSELPRELQESSVLDKKSFQITELSAEMLSRKKVDDMSSEKFEQQFMNHLNEAIFEPSVNNQADTISNERRLKIFLF